MENNFGEVHVLALKKKAHPFLLRVADMGKYYNGCALIVASVVFLN